MSAADILDLSGSLPSDLRPLLTGEWILASFGQTEEFDDTGIAVTDAPISQRMVIAVEVTDASAVEQRMLAWETSGLASADQLFRVRTDRQGTDSFMEGSYKTARIRYLNYPFAHSSIDYAIVTASNGKRYLVMTTSRQSMFGIIDTLLQ
jgi:hypothetical protein